VWDRAKNIEAICATAPHLSWPVFVAGDNRHPDGSAAGADGVRYLGRLDTGGMRRWYARASIYALPARYEPFGLSVLEAAQAGCALVLGDIGSLRENWEGAAVFVAADQPRALRAAIQRLIDDEPRRNRLGALAAARARRFSVDRMAAGYSSLYKRVAGATPARDVRGAQLRAGATVR
jgi:glycosyltransferase involved in cell wall biosynthesis